MPPKRPPQNISIRPDPEATENESTSFHSATTDENLTDYHLESFNNASKVTPRLQTREATPPNNKTPAPPVVFALRTLRSSTASAGNSSTVQSPVIQRASVRSSNSSTVQSPVIQTASVRSNNSSTVHSPETQASHQETLQRPTKNRRKPKRPPSKFTALHEIMHYQKSYNNLIPKLPFCRLVKECLHASANSNEPFRVTQDALRALQESAEMYLVQLFQDSYLLALHRKRVTLTVGDMEIVRVIRGVSDPGCL